MSIHVQCRCGRHLKAGDEFAGKRAECSYCGQSMTVPAAADAIDGDDADGPEREEAVEITEFLDPPSAPVVREKKHISLRPMLEALLDPRSIQWMLILGGGLAVLGLVVWLASWGVFKGPVVLAAALGIGSLAILAQVTQLRG